jgi:superfamily II DNA or RNA helicase
MELRDYQVEVVQGLRTSIINKNKRLIMCLPTGGGKTIVFSFMVSEHLKRGGRCLIFTHRKELLNQASGSFKKFGLDPELITANKKADLQKNLHVAMVETFNRRILDYELFLKTRTMIIIDECHLDSFTKIFNYIDKNTVVIGATATPFRKGKQPCLSEFYTDMFQSIDSQDLIDMGFLSKASTYGIPIELKGLKKIGDDYDTSEYYEKNKTYEGVVENWSRICKNTKTILFSSNVANSMQVCREFNINGFHAKHIDGTTPQKEREEILEWFDKNDNAIICNCGILNAGFDQPDIKTVILYRATTSLPLFLQMCGRGSRTTENKNTFTILDFGDNIKRLGFWEDRRIWSLHKKVKKTKEGAAPIKICPSCNFMLHVKIKECPNCGYEWKEKPKEVEIIELKLMSKKELLKSTVHQKVLAAKNKLINPYHLLHQMTDINEAREFCKLMGYKKGWEFYNKDRFKVFQQ